MSALATCDSSWAISALHSASSRWASVNRGRWSVQPCISVPAGCSRMGAAVTNAPSTKPSTIWSGRRAFCAWAMSRTACHSAGAAGSVTCWPGTCMTGCSASVWRSARAPATKRNRSMPANSTRLAQAMIAALCKIGISPCNGSDKPSAIASHSAAEASVAASAVVAATSRRGSRPRSQRAASISRVGSWFAWRARRCPATSR